MNENFLLKDPNQDIKNNLLKQIIEIYYVSMDEKKDYYGLHFRMKRLPNRIYYVSCGNEITLMKMLHDNLYGTKLIDWKCLKFHNISYIK